MQIDPRLNGIDDCLYRVAARALIVQDNKLLLVKETSDGWWAFPGGGVDHGESIESCLVREVEEELGVAAHKISSDFHIAYYTIGSVVNGVPRMNIFFKVVVPENLIRKTSHVTAWEWCTRGEFLMLPMNPSYDKSKLVNVIFGT